MDEINLSQLILPSLFIFVSGLFILNLYLKNLKITFMLVSLKVAVFCVYFLFFFNTSDLLVDDVRYIIGGLDLLNQDLSILDIFNSELNKEIYFITRTSHVGYFFVNKFFINIFGYHYYAPISFNIVVTFLSAMIFYFLVLRVGLSKLDALILNMLFLFHWDVLLWSTFFNIKDIIVEFLILLLIYSFSEIILEKRFKGIFFIIFSIGLLIVFRFYIPVLFLFTILVFLVISRSKYPMSINIGIISITLSILGVLIANLLPAQFEHFMHYYTNPFMGAIRFLLTPLPFSINDRYIFLLIGSIVNLFLFPFLLIGYYFSLKSKNKLLLFIALFVIILLLFYGTYSHLQGPRHRMSIIPFLLVFEYLGIKKVLSIFKYNKGFKVVKKSNIICNA